MTSKTAVLAVIVFLGFIALVVIIGDVVLMAMDKPTLPGSIEAIAAAAAGGLAGILASTRSTLGPNDTEPSTVTLSSPTPVVTTQVFGTERIAAMSGDEQRTGTFPGKTP